MFDTPDCIDLVQWVDFKLQGGLRSSNEALITIHGVENL